MPQTKTPVAVHVTGIIEYRDADGNLLKAVPVRSAGAPAETAADPSSNADLPETHDGLDL